jgi:hypothetical protein
MNIIIDLALALLMLVLVIPIFWLLRVPDAFFVSIGMVILTILTFTVLSAIRYPIAAVLIGGTLLFRLYLYARYWHPWYQGRQILTEYYGEKLYERLREYQLLWVDSYGYEPFPEGKDKGQVYLFMDEASANAVLQQPITSTRWEFIQLIGKPDRDTKTYELIVGKLLYVILILERDHAPPLALPFFGGKAPIGNTFYRESRIWREALEKLCSGAKLTLYSTKRRANLWLDAKYYISNDMANRPSFRLSVPAFPHEMLLLIYTAEYIERLCNWQPKADAEFLIERHLEKYEPEIILHAIKLSKQK